MHQIYKLILDSHYSRSMKCNKLLVNSIVMSMAFLYMWASCSYAQHYEHLNPILPGCDVIDFCDASLGFAAGTNGIVRTTNGGKTWQNVSNVSGSKISIAAPSANRQLVLAGTQIYLSDNQGVSWYPKTTSFNPLGMAVAKGSTQAIAYTNSTTPEIYYTKTGFVWTKVTIAQKDPILGISMGSPSVAVATGVIAGPTGTTGNVYVLFSIDSGHTWSSGTFVPPLKPSFYPAYPYSCPNPIHMINESVGFLITRGYGDSLYQTTNGGITWSKRSPLPYYTIGAFSFLDNMHGVLLGYASSNLSLTSDGGVTWSSVSGSPGSGCTDVKYVSDSVIVLTGPSVRFLRTSDRGQTWVGSSQDAYSTSAAGGRIAVRKNVGIAASLNTTSVARSTNGGQSWVNASCPLLTGAASSISFASDSIVFLTMNTDSCIYSSDAGVTWKKISIGLDTMVTSMDFLDSSGFGVAVGAKGEFSRTFDFGNNWEQLPTSTTNTLRKVVIRKFDSEYIYACGDNSTVIGSADRGVTWSVDTAGLPNQTTSLTMIDIVDEKTVVATMTDTMIAFPKCSSGGSWPAKPVSRVRYYDRSVGRWTTEHFNYNYSNGKIISLRAIAPSLTLSTRISTFDDCGLGLPRFFGTVDRGQTWSQDVNSPLLSSTDHIPVDIYPAKPTKVFFVNGNDIWRRIQGDYVKKSEFDFGPILMGRVKDSALTIKNIGDDTLNVTSITLASGGGAGFSLPGGGSTLTINSNDNKSIAIRFTPDQAKAYQDTLFLSSNALSQTKDTVLLSGVGSDSNVSIFVQPSQCLEFDTVHAGTSKIESFVIKSTGNSPLTVDTMYFSNGLQPPFFFLSPTSYSQIVPLDSVVVQIKCEPRDTGDVHDTVVINSTAYLNNPTYVCLHCIGKQTYFASVVPDNNYRKVNLGTVLAGTPIDTLIRFRSSGNDLLVITSIEKQEGTNGYYTIDKKPTLPDTLYPGMSDSVSVSFFSNDVGTWVATIVYASNAPEKYDTITITAKVEKEVGVEEKPSIPIISLGQNYPNPFSGSSVITYQLWPGIKTGMLEVKDILGRIVYSKEISRDRSQVIVDASHWQPGVYFYSLFGYPSGVKMMSVVR